MTLAWPGGRWRCGQGLGGHGGLGSGVLMLWLGCVFMRKCQREAEPQREQEEGGLERRGRAVSHQRHESGIYIFS